MTIWTIDNGELFNSRRPSSENDLKEARDFLNSKRKGFGQKFLTEYKFTLKNLQNNPQFQIRYKQIRCIPTKTFKYMIHLNVN